MTEVRPSGGIIEDASILSLFAYLGNYLAGLVGDPNLSSLIMGACTVAGAIGLKLIKTYVLKDTVGGALQGLTK